MVNPALCLVRLLIILSIFINASICRARSLDAIADSPAFKLGCISRGFNGSEGEVEWTLGYYADIFQFGPKNIRNIEVFSFASGEGYLAAAFNNLMMARGLSKRNVRLESAELNHFEDSFKIKIERDVPANFNYVVIMMVGRRMVAQCMGRVGVE
jgi:hypothetical protein